jgi:hypothetical protein
VQGNALIKLALQTLSTFDFGRVQLLEFTRDHILTYTDDSDKEIRQAAVLACCKVGVQAAVHVCALGGDHVMSAGTPRPVVLGYKE